MAVTRSDYVINYESSFSFRLICWRGDIIIVMLMRNLQSVNAFYMLGGLAFCLILMVQIRQIYDNKLKYNRYLGYKQFVSMNLDDIISQIVASSIIIEPA